MCLRWIKADTHISLLVPDSPMTAAQPFAPRRWIGQIMVLIVSGMGPNRYGRFWTLGERLKTLPQRWNAASHHAKEILIPQKLFSTFFVFFSNSLKSDVVSLVRPASGALSSGVCAHPVHFAHLSLSCCAVAIGVPHSGSLSLG